MNKTPPDRAGIPGRVALLGVIAVIPLVLLATLHADPLDAGRRLWPILPLAYVGGAVANATAIGGGFLFVPLFIFAYGVEPLVALKLSLGSQSVGMSSGALGWSRRFIDLRALAVSSAFAFVGMLAGTLVWAPSPLEVKAVFGWVSILIAVVVVVELRLGSRASAEHMPPLRAGELIGFGLACVIGGIVTAWVSLGIGEVVALWLLFRHRVRIEKAIGTGVAALALCSIMGMVLHTSRDFAAFPWEYLAFTAPGVALGGFSGARAARWLEAKMLAQGKRSPLKVIFAVVVLLDGIVMLAHVHMH